MTTRKLPLVLLLMMVIVSAGSLIQLQPASATFPGRNGKIVFQRNTGAAEPQTQIFTVNPDGSGLAQLTNTGINRLPRWSADGTKIVFISGRSGNNEIWVMNADGSGQTQITHTVLGSCNSPAFSPDGSKIVYENYIVGGNIWVINADGSGLKQLTSTDNDFDPIWSPDGSKIAFHRFISSKYDIFVMNAADGSGQTDISLDPSSSDVYPEWSPDGRMITFTSMSGGVWVMNADGSGRKQLSTPPGILQDFTPAWSPDGAKIAFVRSSFGSVIVVNSADGSNLIDITAGQPNSDTDFAPNWQPLFPNPVGGVVMPTSKLEIVAPFAALAGLIVAVSAVVAVKRRKD
jgi:Tol biopolymer transport system component